MKAQKIFGMILAAGIIGTAFTNANAQGSTGPVEMQGALYAQNDAGNQAVDGSNPGGSQRYEQPAVQMNSLQGSGSGAGMSGASGSGAKDARSNTRSADTCVGPASFCNIYFGS
ncbi:hypothetical protein [Paraburkholderia silvatlantica]|uniref:hypothetical protein n=1 Tax=Paraburkholderia silvatlantica TaxID=321895 RepID=UPI0037522D30